MILQSDRHLWQPFPHLFQRHRNLDAGKTVTTRKMRDHHAFRLAVSLMTQRATEGKTIRELGGLETGQAAADEVMALALGVLLDALEGGVIPISDVTAFTARQLRSLADESISSRLAKTWGNVRETPRERTRQIERWIHQGGRYGNQRPMAQMGS